MTNKTLFLLLNYRKVSMKNKEIFLFSIVALTVLALFPDLAHANFESSLVGLKTKLTGVVLPVLSVIGVCIAAISFFTGNPNAKTHAFYAVIGAAIGFGSQAIVDFISQIVH
jgi:type IV secretory pathway VirB2 component (pilin)